MSKVLVSLDIPSLDEQVDLLVPDFLEIGTLTPLLVEAVCEYSGGRYRPSYEEILCLKERNLIFRQDCTLFQYSVGNGDHLILI